MSLVTDESSSEFRQLCRDYYYSKLDEIYDDFIARYVSETTEDDQISKKSFVFENEAVKGINRRVNYLPVDYVLVSDDRLRARREEWEKYFKGDYFNGRPLKQLLPDIYRYMELGGVAILVGYKNPDDNKAPLWILMTNVEYTPITNDDNVFIIEGYRFVYHRKEADKNGIEQDVEVIVTVDLEGYVTTVKGSEVEELTKNNPLSGKLPVVVFCREDLDGVYCRPGMADLLNGQRNLNAALTKRNEATKYDSFGVWCPEGNENMGFDLSPDAEGNNPQFVIKPGSYFPFPIKKVGTASSLPAIEKEILEARKDIMAAATFTDSVDSNGVRNNESGISKLVGTRGLRDYGTQILAQVKNSLNRLLELTSEISGVNAEGIAFAAPPVETESPEIVANKADRIFNWGFERKALELEGFSNDEIEKMLTEREERQEKEIADARERAGRESREIG
jgi:hypothetical protein